MIRLCILQGILAAFAMSAIGAAADPAALVIAVRGVPEDLAAPFSEAEAGTRFDLGAEGEMILLHYAACRETHFQGGAVKVGSLEATTTGSLVAETEVECPRKVAFADNGAGLAAVILRGGEEAPARLAAQPVFVLLTDEPAVLEIRRAGAVVATLKPEGRLARWPEGAPALAAGETVEIRLSFDGSERILPGLVSPSAGVMIIEP